MPTIFCWCFCLIDISLEEKTSFYVHQVEEEEIWHSHMTKTTKNVDCRTTTDRLSTTSWGNDCHWGRKRVFMYIKRKRKYLTQSYDKSLLTHNAWTPPKRRLHTRLRTYLERSIEETESTHSLCRVELVQFPARSSTQVLLCLFPGVLRLWHFLNRVGPHPESSLHIHTFVVSRAFMADAASQAGDADSSRVPGIASGLQGSVNVHRGALLLVPQWQCISFFVFYIPTNRESCVIKRTHV